MMLTETPLVTAVALGLLSPAALLGDDETESIPSVDEVLEVDALPDHRPTPATS